MQPENEEYFFGVDFFLSANDIDIHALGGRVMLGVMIPSLAHYEASPIAH